MVFIRPLDLNLSAYLKLSMSGNKGVVDLLQY